MKLKISPTIISVGKDILLKKRELRIQSLFTNVINFIDEDDHLISIVSNKIGGGPNNIVVDDIKDFNNMTLIIRDHSVCINDYEYFQEELNYYDDRLPNISFDRSIFIKNIKILKKMIIKKGNPISAIFLLDSLKERNFNSPFKRNLMQYLKKGTNDLLASEFKNGIKLSGTGIGLTPQGDDLINGILLGLGVYEKITGKSTFDIRKSLYKTSNKTNIISQTFLYYSYIGRYYMKFKNLFIAFTENKDINVAIMNYLNIGETSGADILTGFIITMQKLFDLED
jgi:hypothetical protein